MDYNNRLKGTITQTLLRTLLEGAGYRVVPFGIESVIREVQVLSQQEYGNLRPPLALRTMPDFFITNKEMNEAWLVEVKYRRRWDERTRNELGETLKLQVKVWGPIYLMVCLAEPATKNKETPSSRMRLAQLKESEDVLVSESPAQDGQKVFWKDISWENFHRIQDVFRGINAPELLQQQTLIQTCRALDQLGTLE